MKRQTMNTRPFSLPIWAQALLAGAAFAAYASQAAYADSLEERLRTQLRLSLIHISMPRCSTR